MIYRLISWGLFKMILWIHMCIFKTSPHWVNGFYSQKSIGQCLCSLVWRWSKLKVVRIGHKLKAVQSFDLPFKKFQIVHEIQWWTWHLYSNWSQSEASKESGKTIIMFLNQTLKKCSWKRNTFFLTIVPPSCQTKQNVIGSLQD